MIVYTLMAHHPNKDQDIFVTALILYALLFTLIPGIYKYIVLSTLIVIDAGLYWYYRKAAAVYKPKKLNRKGVGHKSRHSKSIRRASHDPWYSDNISVGSGSNYAYLDRQFYDTQFGGAGGSGSGMSGGATWMYQDRMFNNRGLGECTRWSYDKAFQRSPPASCLSPSTVRLPPDAKDPLMIDNRERVHELDPYNDAASIVYDMSSYNEDTITTMSVDPDE